MESYGRISLQTKQICSNRFVLPTSSGSTGSGDSTKTHPMEATSMLLGLLLRTYKLHCSSSVNLLMNVFQKSDEYSHCNIAYRRMFSQYRLAHGLACTRNTDDRLVEPPCCMFLQGSLTFPIHHLPNLYTIRMY